MAAEAGLQKDGDLADNYKGAFDGHLTFGRKPCLLIIDFVQAYLDTNSPIFAGVQDALTATQRLLALARAKGVLVIHTNVEFLKGGLNGGVFYRKIPLLKIFEAGSPLGAFPPELTPLSTELVVTKQYASAFFGTSLASTLTAAGVDTLLITGVSTSGCVRATATDACQHGFVPIVVRDAVGDRHQAVHDANLFDLQAKYAEVMDEAAVTTYLNGL